MFRLLKKNRMTHNSGPTLRPYAGPYHAWSMGMVQKYWWWCVGDVTVTHNTSNTNADLTDASALVFSSSQTSCPPQVAERHSLLHVVVHSRGYSNLATRQPPGPCSSGHDPADGRRQRIIHASPPPPLHQPASISMCSRRLAVTMRAQRDSIGETCASRIPKYYALPCFRLELVQLPVQKLFCPLHLK